MMRVVKMKARTKKTKINKKGGKVMNNVGQILFQGLYDGIQGALKALIFYDMIPHIKRKIDRMNEKDDEESEEETSKN